MTARVDAGALLHGLAFHPLPDGYTPISACLVLKSMAPDGDVELHLRATEDLRLWDILGMLAYFDTDVVGQVLDELVDDEDDEDDEA